MNSRNPKVFFDIVADSTSLGRIIMEVSGFSLISSATWLLLFEFIMFSLKTVHLRGWFSLRMTVLKHVLVTQFIKQNLVKKCDFNSQF